MKILVPIKRVIDPYVKIRIKADNSGVETNNVKMAMNPFDEIAVEEAIRIKENDAQANHEVILVLIGNQQGQETLRNGLAMGADRAIHILTDEGLQPLTVAKILSKIIEQHAIECAILGKQAIDNDHNQTGQMLAALLDWPQATFASKMTFNDNTVTVTREIDGGLETLALQLPAVITTDLRLNQPRYATLPNIMKAKSKPLETIKFSDLGIESKASIEVLSVQAPPERSAGVILDSVNDLVQKLKTEEQVI